MRKVAVRSLKWSFLQQFSTQIINYISVIVLAALVGPSIQGFATIASIPVGFVGILGSLGVREKIVKEKEITEEYKQGLLGFILLISIILFIISLILSLIIAWVYKTNFDFDYLVKYGFLISASVPVVVLNHYFESFQTRDLNFKALSIINSISLIIGIVVSVLVAYLGFGYLSLSLKMVLPNMFNLMFYLFYFKPSLKFKWIPHMYKSFKSFSTYLTLNNIANYFVRNIDYLIIGKVFSADILGQYSIAYKILLFPMKNVTSRIQSVALPMLSKLVIMSNDFKRKYTMIIGLVAFVVFPLMAYVVVTADVWVPWSFSSKYNLLVDMITVLAIVGTFQSLVSPVGTLYLLTESTKLMFRNSIINSIVIALVFLISSLSKDIFIVLGSYAVSWMVLIMPISMYWIYKEHQMKISSFFITIAPAFISISLALVVLYLYKSLGLFAGYVIIELIISFVILVAVYLGSYHLINKEKDKSLKFYYNLIRGK